tara:strand:+ start:11823 stop:12629 length:807 start_codon:yes stop_codon:yes gene_type:complete
MGEVVTINETDFIWMNGKPEGITRAVLFDAIGSDHIPAVVGSSMVKDIEPIGYMSSKHIASSPHTLLSLGFTGWPIYRGSDENTIVVEVLTPAHISRDMSAQKNAWLFNYPPARDVARMLNDLGCETFCVLTSDAFDAREGRGLEKPMLVKGEDIGAGDIVATDSLQTLWGWLPAFMFAVERKGAHVMVIPSHGHGMEVRDFQETHINGAIDILKNLGFKIAGCKKRAKDLYYKASSDTVEAAKLADDMITKMRNKTRASQYEGGMFG